MIKLKQRRLRVIRDLLRGSFAKYLLLYGFAIVLSILEALSIVLVFPLFSFVMKTDGDYVGLPPILLRYLRTIQANLNLELVCLFLIVVFIGKSVFKFLLDFRNTKVANEIRGKWMNDLYHKYIYSNYMFFIHSKHGVLISNLFTLTVQSVGGLRQLVRIFMFSVSCFLALLAILMISWQITSVSIFLIAIVSFLLNKPITRKALSLGTSRFKSYQQVNAIPAEAFQGIREIKTYSAEKDTVAYYKKAVNSMIQLIIRINFYQLLPAAFPEIVLVTFLSGALIILNRMPDVNLNQLFPLMATYAYALLRFFFNGSNLVKSYMGFSNEWPSIKHLHDEIRSEKHEERDQGTRTVVDTGKNLRFEDVSFSYSNDRKVITGINTEFKKGEFTAIVGGSGEGKSTIANLIIRLYMPDSGAICNNGVKINEYSLSAWRSQIGLVSQDIFLFHGTIRENISFGLKNKVSEEDIVEAAKKSNAHDFIMNTEKGYDTIVGERGEKLSVGQRQRISIARALVRNPKILIFDEATSALDTLSEKLVLDTLEKIKNDVILIVITHRISAVLNADKILVLKNGKIIEEGTHRDILEKKGEYWRLYHESP